MIYEDVTQQCERYAELEARMEEMAAERGLATALATAEAGEFREVAERLVSEFERRGIFGLHPHHGQLAKRAMLPIIVRVWLAAQGDKIC